MERNSDDDSLLNSFWKLNPHGRDGETEDESSCSGNRAQDRSKTLEMASNCSGMKRSSSEFEFQAFLRMKMANSGGNEDQSLTEDNNGGIRAEKARICGDFGTLFSVDGEKCFENVCGSGLGEMDTELKQRLFQNFAAVYGNRDTVNSYSTCAQVTSGLGWSENLNPRHSSVAATIESQSSICGPASMSSGLSFGCTGSGLNGSPTSPNKPKSGDCQVRTATSGSSREQSDDDDLEIETGQCEQSMGNTDLKRMRRMVSNRESARRSRRRKQAQLADLEFQVDQLKGQNASLHKQLIDINQKCGDAATNNQVLRSDVEALRATVKMAEDMVSRENAACNVNHQLFQSRSIPPRHLLNARYLSRPSEVPAATDESGYASSITVSGRIPAIGTETGGTQNPIIRNKLDECLPLQRIASLEQLQNRISAGVGAASCGSELWP